MRFSKDCWQCEYPECGHVWIASGDDPPSQCAKCRKRNWHTPDATATAEFQPIPQVQRRNGKRKFGKSRPAEEAIEQVRSVPRATLRPAAAELAVQTGTVLASQLPEAATEISKPSTSFSELLLQAQTERMAGGSKPWFPNSKCPHGYQNSFVCSRENGGC